jgi:general secretion pathway protein C
MLARLITLLVWALLAASMTFWGLKLFTNAPGAPAGTPAGTPRYAGGESGPPKAADLARLLGTASADASGVPSAISSRFRLEGVVASPLPGGFGVALISVDSKASRVFKVGSVIDRDLVLQSVGVRSASIGPMLGAPLLVLELPVVKSAPIERAAAATATAPAAAAVDGTAGVPSVRMATPDEKVRGGRRNRLRGQLVQPLADQ